MNISHRHRFVYLAPPRTASRYVFSVLKEAFPDLQGDPLRPEVLTHRLEVPAECHSHFVFATVRCPYSRWVSAWRWFKQIADAPGACDVAKWAAEHPDDFDGFTERAHAVGGPLCSLTQGLAWVDRIDGLVRLDTLEEDLLALPFVTELCVEMRQEDWRKLFTERTAGLVRECWGDDLESFGYDPERWRV